MKWIWSSDFLYTPPPLLPTLRRRKFSFPLEAQWRKEESEKTGRFLSVLKNSLRIEHAQGRHCDFEQSWEALPVSFCRDLHKPFPAGFTLEVSLLWAEISLHLSPAVQGHAQGIAAGRFFIPPLWPSAFDNKLCAAGDEMSKETPRTHWARCCELSVPRFSPGLQPRKAVEQSPEGRLWVLQTEELEAEF